MTKVNLKHNHELVLDSSHRIITRRDIPLWFQKELETNDDQGISLHITVQKHPDDN
jgi:hypothetical protein